jgi:FKBP-type peptidyl-prolyl cis-trans isomerase
VFKRYLVISTVLFLLLSGISYAAVEELNTKDEKISYMLGVDIGMNLKNIPHEIDFEVFLQGLRDSFEGEETLLTQGEVAAIKQELIKEMQMEAALKIKELADKNKKEGEKFLAENKEKESVKTTESGLQYMVLEKGDGPVPEEDDEVTVHYKGTLIDGTEFDSSYQRGEPVTFPLGGVIPGWTEGLQLMNVGSKYRFFIPSELAYGQRGASAQIGPNSVLIFDVELLEIKE